MLLVALSLQCDWPTFKINQPISSLSSMSFHKSCAQTVKCYILFAAYSSIVSGAKFYFNRNDIIVNLTFQCRKINKRETYAAKLNMLFFLSMDVSVRTEGRLALL